MSDSPQLVTGKVVTLSELYKYTNKSLIGDPNGDHVSLYPHGAALSNGDKIVMQIVHDRVVIDNRPKQ